MKILITLILLPITLISFSQEKIKQWDRFEARFESKLSKNNPFNESFEATFSSNDTTIIANGFYDGSNSFVIRFMPEKVGQWTFQTKSSLAQLNNKKGSFECIKANSGSHGIVKVSNIYHFKYADGSVYFPFGTTAYAWTHMGNNLQEITLKSLKASGFNKIRMCVFPKNYDLVKEEPELYPYLLKETQKSANGNVVKIWDYSQFNPAFFKNLEKRIDDLKAIGIEADMILFHPYDKGRWGFDEMPMEANIKYIRYLTARISSFSNVWWSLANEYDYVKSKTEADWEKLIKEVAKNDPYHHLCTIHGSTAKYFKYGLPEITHASIQDESPVINWGAAAIVRNIYEKPIIFDEVGYEGNLKSRWGRYSGEEMNHLTWMGLIGGTYVTHGESYDPQSLTSDPLRKRVIGFDTIFWAKGGEFRGESWKRAAFQRKILEETGPVEMADVSRDFKTATNGNGTYLVYFGKEINENWTFNLPHKNSNFDRPKKGNTYKVEIIDTWEMTIKKEKDVFEIAEVNDYRVFDKDYKKIRLPLKPFLVLRITEIKN